MSDYNKLTVANLRQLLKDRGIASTGLTRKAQIIEKLEERDRETAEATAEAEPSPEAPEAIEEPDQAEELAQDEVAQDDVTAPESAALEAAPQTETSEAPQAVETSPAEQTIPPQSPTPQEMPTISPKPVEPILTEVEKTHVAGEVESKGGEEVQPEEQPPQTETQDFAMTDARTPSPDPNEKQSVEKATLLPIPEQEVNTSVEASRLNTEELEADTRKRKRRSQSPDIVSQDSRAKRSRPSDVGAPEVHLKEDEDVVMEQAAPEPTIDQNAETENKGKTEGVESGPASPSPAPATAPETEASPQQEGKVIDTGSTLEKKEKETRYKDLFQAAEPASPAEPEAPTDDRPIIPAVHAATPAIYIRDFMRPLRPDPLRKHLISIASPPSAPLDQDVVKSLFLDPMRTHALVLFTNTTAASRARSSLHGSIWPPEGQRKELWVDFVPADKVEDWIKEEEEAIAAEKEARAAGRPMPARRFEVVYPETDDGEVQAVFQEVGARAPANAPRGPKGTAGSFRRGSEQAGFSNTAPNPQRRRDEETRKDLGKSFQTLDQLFNSTTAKPKLYYLPVSNQIADRRREELREETSRDYFPDEKVRGRGAAFSRLDQKVRFSFDEDDRLIEVGGDFGPWRDDTGFRGGARGGRGGFRGGGGGFRGGRGGFRGAGRLD